MKCKKSSKPCTEGSEYKFPLSKKIFMIYFIIHFIILVTILLVTYSDLRSALLMLYAAIVFMEVVMFTGIFAERFMIESDGIRFYKFFKCSKVLYKEIDSIVISHAWHDRHPGAGWLGKFKRCSSGKIRFRPYPWITCCDRIPDKVIAEVSKTLLSSDVDYFLKNNGLLYSFLWNRCAMENLLMHQEVNLFITNSIAVRYRTEIEEMAAKYKVLDERIHIIKDKVAMQWLWDNDFESW